MKRLIIILFTVALYSSCEKEDSEPRDPLAMAIEDIQANQKLLDKAYTEVAKYITADTIKHVRELSKTRTDFILNMTDRTEGLFEKIVKSNKDEAAVSGFIKIEDIKGESQATRQSRFFTFDDPVEAYASSVMKDAETKNADGHKKWIVVQSYQQNDGTTIPLDQITANHHQIISMKDLLVSSLTSEEEQEETLDKLLIDASVPPVLVALLLPAVQKYTEGPSQDPYLNWLNTEVNPEINGGLNRDIIRRIAAAEFLGGLELLVNENYNTENQESASLQILQRRFETSLVFLWGEAWVDE